MDIFTEFRQHYRPTGPRVGVPRTDPAPGRVAVPDPIESLVREQQIGALNDGLLWWVDPREFDEAVDEFASGQRLSVFARTAFGDMIAWGEAGVVYVSVTTAQVDQMTDDVDIFFNYTLVSKDFIQKVLKKSVFDAVRRRLGPVGLQQCYAFVPALALGGDGSLESVQLADLHEHLHLLVQLAG
jgi:hypothetical protein